MEKYGMGLDHDLFVLESNDWICHAENNRPSSPRLSPCSTDLPQTTFTCRFTSQISCIQRPGHFEDGSLQECVTTETGSHSNMCLKMRSLDLGSISINFWQSFRIKSPGLYGYLSWLGCYEEDFSCNRNSYWLSVTQIFKISVSQIKASFTRPENSDPSTSILIFSSLRHIFYPHNNNLKTLLLPL